MSKTRKDTGSKSFCASRVREAAYTLRFPLRSSAAAIFRHAMVSPCGVLGEHQPKSAGTTTPLPGKWLAGACCKLPSYCCTAGCSAIPSSQPAHIVNHLPHHNHHTTPLFNTLRSQERAQRTKTLQPPQPSLQQSRSWRKRPHLIVRIWEYRSF